MNGSWKRAAVASALCLGLAAAASVGAAQDRTRGADGQPGAAGPGQHRAEHQKMFEAMRARHEKAIHDILMIKPDQEGAFRSFLAATTPPARDGKGGGWHDRAPGADPATTPERLDRMSARLAERQARFQTRVTATKAFYTALTPEQRRAFDALPIMALGGRHGMHGGWRGHMGDDSHPGGPA